MRLGVIDVGSNTVHLLVVDAHWGAHPLPAVSHKVELRLDLRPGLPSCSIDPTYLEMALLNVVINAREGMPRPRRADPRAGLIAISSQQAG